MVEPDLRNTPLKKMAIECRRTNCIEDDGFQEWRVFQQIQNGAGNPIGHIRTFVYDLKDIPGNVMRKRRLLSDFYWGLDGCSGVKGELAEVIINTEKFFYFLAIGRIAVVDTFFVNKEHRNQGFGTEALRRHLEYLRRYRGVATLFLKAFPLDFEGKLTKENAEEFRKAQQRLVQYYIRRFPLVGLSDDSVLKGDLIHLFGKTDRTMLARVGRAKAARLQKDRFKLIRARLASLKKGLPSEIVRDSYPKSRHLRPLETSRDSAA